MPPNSDSLETPAPFRPLKKRPVSPTPRNPKRHRRYPRLLTTNADGRIIPIPLTLPPFSSPARHLGIPADANTPPLSSAFRPSAENLAVVTQLRQRVEMANKLARAAGKGYDYVYDVEPGEPGGPGGPRRARTGRGLDQQKSVCGVADPVSQAWLHHLPLQALVDATDAESLEGSGEICLANGENVLVSGAGEPKKGTGIDEEAVMKTVVDEEERDLRRLRCIVNEEVEKLEAYSEAKWHILVSDDQRSRIECWLRDATGMVADAVSIIVMAWDLDRGLISGHRPERVVALRAVENEYLRLLEALMIRTEAPDGRVIWTNLTQIMNTERWKSGSLSHRDP